MIDENNSKRSSNLLRWEMWGIIFISLAGSLLHFSFALSGDWKPLGIISAVNESVWEHLKLAFWPALFYAFIEYFVIRPKSSLGHNFFLAKAIGAFSMPVVIVIVFYTYTSFVTESILVVDITTFWVAVAVGQILSYFLITHLKLSISFTWLGLGLFGAGALIFAIFTFYPPHLGIFQDSNTLGYGILNSPH
jgi:hypothetical protein